MSESSELIKITCDPLLMPSHVGGALRHYAVEVSGSAGRFVFVVPSHVATYVRKNGRRGVFNVAPAEL